MLHPKLIASLGSLTCACALHPRAQVGEKLFAFARVHLSPAAPSRHLEIRHIRADCKRQSSSSSLSMSPGSMSGSGSGGRGRGGGRTSSRRRDNNHRRRRRTAGGGSDPQTPPPGQPGRERHRSCVSVGADVYVVQKEDQRSGRETAGTVSRLLTKSAYHPRGIKVMLADGAVGRVSRFADEAATTKKISLTNYLAEEGAEEQLSRIVVAAAEASSKVARCLRSLSLLDDSEDVGGSINVQGEEQKGMDVRANEIFVRELRPHVACILSEEEEHVIICDREKRYEIAFDPLDGSSNLDVSAPTGSIFGIYRRNGDEPGRLFESPARQSLVAAGYTVYSSATELVLAGLGDGVAGFTLDGDTFRRSRESIACPERGPYYSLNEAREPDWPDGLRRWIHDAKRGLTPSGTKCSARYVCSLTADVHRTLLKGGWAGNPRPHLRLLYEAAPLAFIAEKAGGRGSDGTGNLLDVRPTGLHARVCCFLGSKLDLDDLEAYGDVQQNSKRYDA